MKYIGSKQTNLEHSLNSSQSQTALGSWSQSALLPSNLRPSDVDAAQFGGAVTREEVHGLLPDVEAARSSVDGSHYDRVGLASCRGVSDLVARATVGAVPAGNGWCAANACECRQRAKSRVPFSDEAVIAV